MFKKFNNEKWLTATLCVQLIILSMVIINAIQLNNIDKQLDATLESMRTKSAVVGDTLLCFAEWVTLSPEWWL